ncbi:efflux RND transporter periplasmic adaptor subunit [Chondrinema litorale]|uniref:efflux RND transporter periplasmic adaptor subunit n=1 Tax=Chondrinema litorale TaxID=2994555 RepID=UPI0025428DA1|nr:efflux RND transporter periplasmic adaptor subunit [Chondrinema litorale]UZR97409.1 efflux RND transporter periplasmic adaptor subunit [Chondrinema litorale]
MINKSLLLFCFLVFTSAFISSCGEKNNKRITQNKPVSVPVLELKSKSINLPQTYICDIQAVQYVEVRAKVEGYVDKIFVDEGKFVKKGQPLFQLSSFEFKEMVNRASASLYQAKAEGNAAKLEVERLKVLVDKDIITSSELELAKSKLAVAEANITEAASLLSNAKNMLSYTTIKAPFNGIVDKVPFKTGSLVTAGDLMTNITDISEVFAYYKVNENEYLRYMREKIQQGDNAETAIKELSLILSDGKYYPHKGVLETLEADFERGTGSIAFRVRFPNPNGLLKHGATGKIEMTNEMKDVFLIPQKSTFEVQDYNYVYLLNNENEVKVESFRPIKRFDVYYVVDNFKPGDRIIFEGIQQVRDGVKVDPTPITEEEAYDNLVKRNQNTESNYLSCLNCL